MIGSDGRISFRDIRIARDEGNVVRLAGGLQAGEVVALNVSSQIAAGDVVEARLQEAAVPPPGTPARGGR